ncbi:hypothetical protein ACJX0J_017197, partial [Zea mays]
DLGSMLDYVTTAIRCNYTYNMFLLVLIIKWEDHAMYLTKMFLHNNAFYHHLQYILKGKAQERTGTASLLVVVRGMKVMQDDPHSSQCCNDCCNDEG